MRKEKENLKIDTRAGRKNTVLTLENSNPFENINVNVFENLYFKLNSVVDDLPQVAVCENSTVKRENKSVSVAANRNDNRYHCREYDSKETNQGGGGNRSGSGNPSGNLGDNLSRNLSGNSNSGSGENGFSTSKENPLDFIQNGQDFMHNNLSPSKSSYSFNPSPSCTYNFPSLPISNNHLSPISQIRLPPINMNMNPSVNMNINLHNNYNPVHKVSTMLHEGQETSFVNPRDLGQCETSPLHQDQGFQGCQTYQGHQGNQGHQGHEGFEKATFELKAACHGGFYKFENYHTIYRRNYLKISVVLNVPSLKSKEKVKAGDLENPRSSGSGNEHDKTTLYVEKNGRMVKVQSLSLSIICPVSTDTLQQYSPKRQHPSPVPSHTVTVSELAEKSQSGVEVLWERIQFKSRSKNVMKMGLKKSQFVVLMHAIVQQDRDQERVVDPDQVEAMPPQNEDSEDKVLVATLLSPEIVVRGKSQSFYQSLTSAQLKEMNGFLDHSNNGIKKSGGGSGGNSNSEGPGASRKMKLAPLEFEISANHLETTPPPSLCGGYVFTSPITPGTAQSMSNHLASPSNFSPLDPIVSPFAVYSAGPVGLMSAGTDCHSPISSVNLYNASLYSPHGYDQSRIQYEYGVRRGNVDNEGGGWVYPTMALPLGGIMEMPMEGMEGMNFGDAEGAWERSL